MNDVQCTCAWSDLHKHFYGNPDRSNKCVLQHYNIIKICGKSDINKFLRPFYTNMRTSKKWLDALSDHGTDLRTLSSCLSLCDLKSDGYYKLIAADVMTATTPTPRSKLKAFKGTALVSEQLLPGIASSVESFYIDENIPRVPVVAVSVGSSVLFYRNMKPYFKYTLPSLPIDPLEDEIWRKLPNEKGENIPGLITKLRALDKKTLCSVSLQLLSLEEHEQDGFIKLQTNCQLERLSNITAMTTIRKASSSDMNGVSYLILVTESGDVFFLNGQSFSVLHQARVSAFESAPSIISATGSFDIDYRIVISTRQGMICILRKEWLEGRPIIKVDHPVVGLSLLPVDQTIIVVCMNRALDCYSKKGRRLWTVALPEPALCMVAVHLSHLGQTLVCVALCSGLVQLYSKQDLVDQFTASTTVSAMIFGKLGQEDHVLVLVTTDGSLFVKILKRTAEFRATNSSSDLLPTQPGSTAAHSLQIPKKSKVFVEQTVRERENAPAIYANFQCEMWRLRLTAARATVDVIHSAESTISGDIGHVPVKLAAEVLRLGPVFRLFLTVENMAARKEAAGMAVLLHADPNHYLLERPYAQLPPLVPSAPVKIDFKVTAIVDENDGLPPSELTPENSIVRVLVIKVGQAKPLIAATVAMPAPEPLEQDIY